jgi:hypothetical protein
MTDLAFINLQQYLKNYVESSSNKRKALEDISHLSYVLSTEFERQINGTTSTK